MIKLTKSSIRSVPEILLIAVLCYFPLCYKIDALAIRQWDEARNAVNAMEMLQNNNYIVRYFENLPEVWEVKPPLLIWLQVASLKAFGLNELAIRFPIMVATFLIVMLLIWYFHRYHQNRLIGYLAAMVLVTSQGYIHWHIARTGDHDALLILILTIIILAFFHLITSEKPKPKLFIIISLLFVLGVLTKSVAAFFILPGLLISVFVFRSGRKLFYNKWLYIALLLFILLTGSYYITREFMQPGYLNAVWHWELFPRYVNAENNFYSGTFWYYWTSFFTKRFNYWIYFLLIALVATPFLIAKEFRKFYYYVLIQTIVFFLVISVGSKGLWYDGPLFPLFSISIALFLYYMWHYLAEHIPAIRPVRQYVAVGLTALIFQFPGIAIMKKVSRTVEYPWDREHYAMAYWLRDRNHLSEMTKPIKVIYDGYTAHLLFYVEAFNYARKKEQLMLGNFTLVKPDDLVLISQEHLLDSIKNNFQHEIILTSDLNKLVRIGNRLEN